MALQQSITAPPEVRRRARCAASCRAALRCCAALALALCPLAAGGRADAGRCVTCPVGPGCVDFWVIDTRGAPRCGNVREAIDRVAFWHCESTGKARYTRQQFLAATDSSLPVSFYVHGIFSAEWMGMKQARDLFGKAGAGLPPFRGVLWLWPSQFVWGTSIRDQVEMSTAASEVQAFYLAAIVESLGQQTPVSLIGHSLGCRTVTAALHGLAVRTVAGQPLPDPPHVGTRAVQAALVAPAIEPFSLWPNGQYGQALSQLDRMLVTYNPRDRVLRGFERRFDRQALGFRGLPRPAVNVEGFQKVVQINANPSVGKKHIPQAYFRSPSAAAWLRGFVAYTPPTAGNSAD